MNYQPVLEGDPLLQFDWEGESEMMEREERDSRGEGMDAVKAAPTPEERYCVVLRLVTLCLVQTCGPTSDPGNRWLLVMGAARAPF